MLRTRLGQVKTFLATNGLGAYQAPPIALTPCQKRTVGYMDLVIGSGVDGLQEAKRKDFGEAAWRGIFTASSARRAAGRSRTRSCTPTPASNNFTRRHRRRGPYSIHVPPGVVDHRHREGLGGAARAEHHRRRQGVDLRSRRATIR